MSQKVMRAPKRRIERVRCDLSVTSSGTAAYLVLHTAEDKKTLVRVVIEGVAYLEANALGLTNYLLAVSPKSTEISAPSISSSLDQDAPVQTILSFTTAAYGDTTSATPPAIVMDKVYVDTKAMRKLSAGDEITLGHISNGAGRLFNGTVYLWFKE